MSTTGPAASRRVPARVGTAVLLLGLLAAIAQTLLFGLTYVAGVELRYDPDAVSARNSWLAALGVVVLGLVAVFWLTARNRWAVVLVPLLCAAAVVGLALLTGWFPAGTAA